MAYTLGDPFRPLRLILRINGILLGLLLGIALLTVSGTLLIQWQLAVTGVLWSVRLLGAGQVALGCFLLIAAGQNYLDRMLLFTATLTHTLWAITLFVAYFQGELMLSGLWGQVGFVLLFLLCLCGAVVPLRYVRNSQFRQR